MVADLYESKPLQATREAEAVSKYGLDLPEQDYAVESIPLVQIDDMPVMAVPLLDGQLATLAQEFIGNESDYRAITTNGDTIIVYHKPSSHALLLKPNEFQKLSDIIDEQK